MNLNGQFENGNTSRYGTLKNIYIFVQRRYIRIKNCTLYLDYSSISYSDWMS